MSLYWVYPKGGIGVAMHSPQMDEQWHRDSRRLGLVQPMNSAGMEPASDHVCPENMVNYLNCRQVALVGEGDVLGEDHVGSEVGGAEAVRSVDISLASIAAVAGAVDIVPDIVDYSVL